MKLIVMALATFGIYDIVWFYRNWRLERAITGERLWPFWRSIFCVLTFYSLAKAIERESIRLNTKVRDSAGALALAFFLLSLLGRLPSPFFFLGLLSVIPIVRLQQQIEAGNAARGVLWQPQRRFTVGNALGGLTGAAVIALAAYGAVSETRATALMDALAAGTVTPYGFIKDARSLDSAGFDRGFLRSVERDQQLDGRAATYIFPAGTATLEGACLPELTSCDRMEQLMFQAETAVLAAINSERITDILPPGECSTEPLHIAEQVIP